VAGTLVSGESARVQAQRAKASRRELEALTVGNALVLTSLRKRARALHLIAEDMAERGASEQVLEPVLAELAYVADLAMRLAGSFDAMSRASWDQLMDAVGIMALRQDMAP